MSSDCDLMIEVSAGDMQAFDALVQRHRARLEAFLYRLCSDWEQAADCTQETFVRLWLARAEYRPQTKFTTYLYTIALNCHIDCTRRHRARPRTIPLEEQVGPGARAVLQRMVSRSDTPEAVLLHRYEMYRIRRAILQLPQTHRIVFVLAHFEELPYAEIAEILDIPVGTVKSRIHYALAHLRKLL